MENELIDLNQLGDVPAPGVAVPIATEKGSSAPGSQRYCMFIKFPGKAAEQRTLDTPASTSTNEVAIADFDKAMKTLNFAMKMGAPEANKFVGATITLVDTKTLEELKTVTITDPNYVAPPPVAATPVAKPDAMAPIKNSMLWIVLGGAAAASIGIYLWKR